MIKIRPISVLLQIMLDNINELDTGLCALGYDLNGFLHKYSNVEHQVVALYIKSNFPKLWEKDRLTHICNINSNSRFFYTPGEKAPRIKWLKKHIKLNS